MAKRRRSVVTTFLARLARDRGGNTLAIMAAALFPLAGMVGGGIDISRMYITKTRLQHACDAGALAGRKQMGAGVWGSDDDTVARRFFKANYLVNADGTGAYGTSGVTYRFSENAGKVTGNASATLPMTLMKVLGINSKTLAVTCDAEMKLPNTDVMFVLDVTGSMNCAAGDTSCSNNGGVPAPGSKIGGLKTAVKCFYEILAQVDTSANCSTGTPSGGTSSAVQIRFGFMPYASNVNVGYLLPPDYFANTWNYQSRRPDWNTTTAYTSYNPYSDSAPSTQTQTSQSSSTSSTGRNASNGCTAPADSAPSTTTTTESTTPVPGGPTMSYTVTTRTTTTRTTYTATPKVFIILPYCEVVATTTTTVTTTTVTRTATGNPTTVNTFKQWIYGKIPTDVSSLKSGSGWRTYAMLPIGAAGTSVPVSWSGCIEERKTVAQASYSPIPNDAKDLNIDLVPSQSDPDSLWGPALKNAIYYRAYVNSSSQLNQTDPIAATGDYRNDADDYCPTEAKKLQQWPSAAGFEGYVDSLIAVGNTYHDIGMLWGARFMSPTGIFASENAVASNGGTIARHMIFMTDGDSTSSPCDYNAYGVPFFDKRQTTDVGSASNCWGNRQALIDQINVRLTALCTAVKNKEITLWVVSYGGGVNAATEARLAACASPPDSVAATHFFSASDPAALQNSFATIANAISQLRLTN